MYTKRISRGMHEPTLGLTISKGLKKTLIGLVSVFVSNYLTWIISTSSSVTGPYFKTSSTHNGPKLMTLKILPLVHLLED